MMAEANLYNFNDILSQEQAKSDFCKWFWSGTNGNELIDALNANNSQSGGYKIRRQHKKCWPYIYCIVLNDNTQPVPFGRGNAVQWKYCKVGITEQDTTTGAHNRMETVKQEIIKKKADYQITASVIFVLPVCATDSRKNNDIELDVREHIGWKVNKDFAKENNLAVPTEWVRTRQWYINLLSKSIKDAAAAAKKDGREIDTSVLLNVPRFEDHQTMLPPHL